MFHENLGEVFDFFIGFMYSKAMKIKGDHFPCPLFPIALYCGFHQISNRKNERKLVNDLKMRCEKWIKIIETDDSRPVFFHSTIQLYFFLLIFSYKHEKDYEDEPIPFIPNLAQYDHSEKWKPQLQITKKFLTDESLSYLNAYWFENKFLFSFNACLQDGLTIELNSSVDKILNIIIQLIQTEIIEYEPSEEKDHRIGMHKNKSYQNQGARPKIFTLLVTHFKILKGPKSRTTIHNHCEEIYDNLLNILADAKINLQNKNRNKFYFNPLQQFRYFVENIKKYTYTKRIDLKIAEFISLSTYSILRYNS